jgi:L-lysine 6-transaminase
VFAALPAASPSKGVRAPSSRPDGGGRDSSGHFLLDIRRVSVARIRANTRTVTPDKVHETIAAHMLADGFDFVLDLEKSKGTYLYDSRGGKQYLDLFTCFASSPVGYNHPRVATPDFIEKLGRVAVNKPSNSDLYTTEMAEFVNVFSELAATPEMKNLFFISGGALAVENALKTEFDWKIRKNLEKGVNTHDTPEALLLGTRVIHFEQCFHGRSGYTLSLTNTFDPRKTQYFPKFDWPRVLNPKIILPLEGENLERVKGAEQQAISQIETALGEYPDDIAAMIIEPIQGEGGDNHFRPEFLKALRRICDENDIILIFDEIQTGMGMTGTMWACQQLGVIPDILSFGKKTQVCGIMVTDRIKEVRDNVFEVSSRINSTWGGNLVDMVRCQRYLDIIDDENLIENAAAMGKRLLEGLASIAEASGGKLSNARGRGLMCAVDLPTTEARGQFLATMRDHGTIALPCGSVTVRVRPPLNISPAEVDQAIASFEKTTKAL